MAKQHQPKENLLRDAKQMPIRGQRTAEGCEIFAGIRPQGQLSLYFDQDPVYQFNSSGELRRAFVDESRVTAEGGELFTLVQPAELESSTASRLALRKLALTEAETQRLLSDAAKRLAWLKAMLQQQTSSDWSCVGADAETFSATLVNSLSLVGDSIRIANSPAA